MKWSSSCVFSSAVLTYAKIVFFFFVKHKDVEKKINNAVLVDRNRVRKFFYRIITTVRIQQITYMPLEFDWWESVDDDVLFIHPGTWWKICHDLSAYRQIISLWKTIKKKVRKFFIVRVEMKSSKKSEIAGFLSSQFFYI